MVCGFMVGQPGMMTGLQEDRGAMPLIRHREEGQADLCGFQVSLVYRANSRMARDTQRKPVFGGEGEAINKIE